MKNIFSTSLSISFLFILLTTACAGKPDSVSTQQNESPKAIVPGAWQTDKYFTLLEDKTLALVGNHSSLIGDVHLADSLLSAGFKLIKVFSPEHGFRGQAAAGELVNSGVDSLTGLPVISLYGSNRRPKAADLNGIDLIIFDIQDVGTRFYTYISTLTYVMEEAARQNIPMLILDRPNPNGHFIDGPLLEKEHSSFVGLHSIPVVHGLTVAEYARMVNGERWLADGLQCSLHVVPVANYSREMYYELPVAPSPNLADMVSILNYPGLCFFEGTVVSVGRGTQFPFQAFGHPSLPQSKYPFSFTPESVSAAPNPPLINQTCFGLDMRKPTEQLYAVGMLEIRYLIDAYNNFPDKNNFFNPFFEKLTGTRNLRQQIINGKTEAEIRASWQDDLAKFREMRKQYLIYPDIEK